MSFGADVEILKPAKLRNKFKELSKILNSIYLKNDQLFNLRNSFSNFGSSNLSLNKS